MHPVVFSTFERLCRLHAGKASSVLEIGATPDDDTLLNLPCLGNVPTRVGLNLETSVERGGFKILQGNANRMPFDENSFDLILCNSMLEHDPKFWLSLQEINRVLCPGGVAMIGVPGYAAQRGAGFRFLARLNHFWPKIMPGASTLESLCATTPTLLVHNYPGDYYRFSEQAMREVFLESFEILAIETLMTPPRILGVGRKLA